MSADYATLTVAAKGRGSATVAVTADDGNGGSVKDSITVTVKSMPMVASAIGDVSELDFGATHEVSLSGVFSDDDRNVLTFSASSSNSSVVQVSNTLGPSTGSATAITVIGVDEGTVTITITARDADGNSVSDAFDVTMPAVEEEQQVVEMSGAVVSLEPTATYDSVTVSCWGDPGPRRRPSPSAD